jgi:hypothetical protein
MIRQAVCIIGFVRLAKRYITALKKIARTHVGSAPNVSTDTPKRRVASITGGVTNVNNAAQPPNPANTSGIVPKMQRIMPQTKDVHRVTGIAPIATKVPARVMMPTTRRSAITVGTAPSINGSTPLSIPARLIGTADSATIKFIRFPTKAFANTPGTAPVVKSGI